MEFSLIYRSKIIIAAYRGWISPSSRVLDVGCGNAVVTEELRRHFGCFVAGTDVLDYRKRRIPFEIMTQEDKLPFKNREFDRCMFNDVLHHCSRVQELLGEALRVADRVLVFEMEPTLMAKISDRIVNLMHNSQINRAVNLKTLDGWKAYFEKSSLDFEYRQIRKPFLFYPFANFSFNLKNKI